MRIGVIIPARNAAWCLSQCLVGLLEAGFAAGDCIVVDDGSRDETGHVAERFGISLIRLDESGGAAAARNTGVAAQAADVDVILFVDADVVAHPDVRKRVLAHFTEEPDLDALFGSYDDAPAHRGLVSQYRNLLHHYVHTHATRHPASFWTGLGAVRRATWLRVGGFDPAQRMMEDIEFGRRLARGGGKIRLDPQLQGKHLKAWSLVAMIRMDLFDRAIPWSRLMLRDGNLSGELNLSQEHRASALLAALTVAAFLASAFDLRALAVAAMALGAFLIINFDLLRLIARRSGLAGVIAAVPLHMLHYCCAMAGLLWVLLTERTPGIMGWLRAAWRDR
jgi:glycosyltransferase involved in cell wall biosynthesis